MQPALTPPTGFFAQRSQRFENMLILALILHFGVILGLGLKHEKRQFSSQVLDVRLLQSAHDDEPEEPEFIAESNRVGSANAAQSKAQKQPVSTQQEHIKNASKAPSMPVMQKQRAEVIQTQKSSIKVPNKKTAHVSPDLLTQSLKQVAKQTRAEFLQETFKRNPRIKRDEGVSAKGTSYAYYLKLWQQMMESYGQQRYPDAAKTCAEHECRVRFLVAINADGTLRKLQILQSSGLRELDAFTIETVQRTMPFAPFSNKMKEELDVLEVVRIFEFVGQPRFQSSAP